MNEEGVSQLLLAGRHAAVSMHSDGAPCPPRARCCRRYVVGDSRFQRYCKSNPRKMVKMWAEKEMRNLMRLHAAGINCPKPLQVRRRRRRQPLAAHGKRVSIPSTARWADAWLLALYARRYAC